jgi:hypothetical protein
MSQRGLFRFIKPHHWSIPSTSGTYTSGTVYLQLVEIPLDCYVDAIIIANGASVSGNVTVGVYGPVPFTTDTPAGAAVLVQSASTAQAGTGTGQVVTFTETFAPKGKYYIAFEIDNSTGTVFRQLNILEVSGWSGTYARGGGYGTLTDPCPAVTLTGSNIPGAVLRVSR